MANLDLCISCALVSMAMIATYTTFSKLLEADTKLYVFDETKSENDINGEKRVPIDNDADRNIYIGCTRSSQTTRGRTVRKSARNVQNNPKANVLDCQLIRHVGRPSRS